MKRLALILTILVAAASCALSAADAPKRQGWRDKTMGPLYGNVDSVTITGYSLRTVLAFYLAAKYRKRFVIILMNLEM